jgi:hypothetical protein
MPHSVSVPHDEGGPWLTRGANVAASASTQIWTPRESGAQRPEQQSCWSPQVSPRGRQDAPIVQRVPPASTAVQSALQHLLALLQSSPAGEQAFPGTPMHTLLSHRFAQQSALSAHAPPAGIQRGPVPHFRDDGGADTTTQDSEQQAPAYEQSAPSARQAAPPSPSGPASTDPSAPASTPPSTDPSRLASTPTSALASTPPSTPGSTDSSTLASTVSSAVTSATLPPEASRTDSTSIDVLPHAAAQTIEAERASESARPARR